MLKFVNAPKTAWYVRILRDQSARPAGVGMQSRFKYSVKLYKYSKMLIMNNMKIIFQSNSGFIGMMLLMLVLSSPYKRRLSLGDSIIYLIINTVYYKLNVVWNELF